MAARDLPPVEYLRQRLRYEPETGKLYWREYAGMHKAWNTRYAGREAFTALRGTGYAHGRIDDVAYQAHRVVWAIAHGEQPDGQIDHIDHDRTNNRIENLRVVTHAENHKNTSAKRSNTSGATGVSLFKQTRRWSAYIMVGYRKRHLGYFDSFDDAVAARKAAEERYGFHANHGVCSAAMHQTGTH